MDDNQAIPHLGFFLRSGLDPLEYHNCYAFAKCLHPRRPLLLNPCQGYCSLTFLVGDGLVIQFRPSSYCLNLEVVNAAREVYALFAPRTEYIGTVPTSGLVVYSIERIRGFSLRDLQEENAPSTQSTEFRIRLCKDFVEFLSKAWHNRTKTNVPLGKVGKSILPRLEALSKKLPSPFRPKAMDVLNQLHLVTALPWILSHGDIIAANIMVEPASGALNGMVDWAEAEPLPFGVCLYGLEEILGELTPSGFQYRSDADHLRNTFWDELSKLIPELEQESVLRAVKLARDLGVLLWHGIAFDDGAINRVVQEGRDVGEIHKLDAFLAGDICDKMSTKI